MNGYSSHTFKWYNDKGEYYWVKYHFKTEQGLENFDLAGSTEMKGNDPDHAVRDLYEAIDRGEYPSWWLEMQIMTPEEAEKYRFDPFDVTKVWFHADVPPVTIGRMVLNKNPENYFAEVEQAAFSPANFVPGIAASPDKLLQGRLFSYHDTHLHRLGTNYHQLPINRPKAAKVDNYQRDGTMALGNNGGSGPNYYPNSFGGPEPDPRAAEPPFEVAGHVARNPYNHPNDDFFQSGELYRRVMTDMDRDHLITNIVAHLGNALPRIQKRQSAIFYKADPEYGTRVAQGLKLDVNEIKSLAEMPQEERAMATAQ